MLDPDLEQKAALYASGAMTASEQEHFELILEFHDEVKTLVRELQEVMVAATLSAVTRENTPKPSADLKARILAKIEAGAPRAERLGFVVTGPDGFVRWVNEEFTQMCGYSVDEVRGRKLGPLLQGRLTDQHVASSMRTAVNQRKACQFELINYHKDSTPYWVSIQITPIFNDEGDLRWMIARERELKDKPIPAAA